MLFLENILISRKINSFDSHVSKIKINDLAIHQELIYQLFKKPRKSHTVFENP